MKKTNTKQILCLLLALLTVIGLYGCGGTETPPPLNPGGGNSSLIPDDWEDEEDDENVEETPPADNTDDVKTTISLAELAQAKIIIPTDSMLIGENGSGYLYSAVVTLQSTLKSIQKIDLPILQDKQGSESTYEILIGQTNRRESTAVLGEEMSLNDYGYAICGNKIVIRGGSDSALKQAITAFNGNVASRKNKNFYERSMDFVSRSTYLAKDTTLNGARLSEYSIVYPETSDLYEMELAQRMANRLQLLTGRKIKCYSDATAYNANVREILIGQTNRPFAVLTQSGAAYEADAKFVAIVGKTAYDLGLAQTALQAYLEEKIVANQSAITVSAATAATPKQTVSMMGYNINGTTKALYQERVDNLCVMMTKYLPDFLVFQEPAKNMMDLIHMEDYYGYYLGIPRHGEDVPSLAAGWPGANSYAPILYAKDRYEVIEGGTRWMTDTPTVVSKLEGSDYYRIYTYALFRDKVTDEQFIVVNHHLDFDPKVQVITMKTMFKFFNEAYTNIPVIMAGDFNATKSSEVVSKLILDTAGFTSAGDMTVNIDTPATAGDIDFIFVTDCCVGVRKFTMCRDTYPDIKSIEFDHKMPSDHPAVYAELMISSKTQCTHDWSAATNYTYKG